MSVVTNSQQPEDPEKKKFYISNYGNKKEEFIPVVSNSSFNKEELLSKHCRFWFVDINTSHYFQFDQSEEYDKLTHFKINQFILAEDTENTDLYYIYFNEKLYYKCNNEVLEFFNGIFIMDHQFPFRDIILSHKEKYENQYHNDNDLFFFSKIYYNKTDEKLNTDPNRQYGTLKDIIGSNIVIMDLKRPIKTEKETYNTKNPYILYFEFVVNEFNKKSTIDDDNKKKNNTSLLKRIINWLKSIF